MPYADPTAKAAHGERYRAERREELAAKQRDYYRRTRAARYAAMADYNARHPEMVKRIRFANRANTRAKRWGAGKIYAKDLKDLRGPCAYCGGAQDTWDHVVPMSRGGSNDISNLVPCCTSCNRAKARRTPEEWRAASP